MMLPGDQKRLSIKLQFSDHYICYQFLTESNLKCVCFSNTNLSDLSGLAVPSVKSNQAEAAFNFCAAHICNKLAEELRLETMLSNSS